VYNELHTLYSSQNINRVIKSRMMKLSGHLAYLRELRNLDKILVWKPEGKIPLLGDLGVDGRMISK
jgi:hypothetical protein